MDGVEFREGLEDGAGTERIGPLIDRIFIDECLSAALVAVAKSKGFTADYGPHIGKVGWQDWNIVAFALQNNYIIVTNNRRHFLNEYIKIDVHSGVRRGDDIMNKVVEVLRDGSVHIREWTSEEHDLSHIDNPQWR